MDIASFLNFELWGNSGSRYATVFLVFVGLTIFFKIFQVIVVARLKKLSKKTSTDIDDFLMELVTHVKPPFYFIVSLFISLQFLSLSRFIEKISFGIFVIIVVIQVIITSQKVIDYVIRKKLLKPGEEDKNKEAVIKLAGQIAKGALWVVGGLMVLSNLGVDVTSLIAGLGIGGIAIAFAVKDIIEDIFSSFSIFVDKPFEVGDFISISADEKGTVEKIGVKTTRLRTLQGQELVIANKKLTEANLENFKKMKKRRVVFGLGVVYETSNEKLKRIPSLLEEIIKNKEGVIFDRAHFKDYGDFSLNFEVVYHVDSSEYSVFMDKQQEINYEIFDKFASEGIEFAYPTQTVFLQKNSQESQSK